MPRPDRLTWDARFDDWVFAVAVGLALGVCVAGLYRYRRGERRSGTGLILAGVVLGLICVASVLDVAGPVNRVRFDFKPFASTVLEATTLATGLFVGAAAAVATILSLARWGAVREFQAVEIVGPAVLAAVGVGCLLWVVDWYNTHDENPRHPMGTIIEKAVPASKVIEGLDIPTGIAIASNGDLAVVELSTANLRLYRPEALGFVEVFRTRLPVSEKSQAFHVVFHPEYPAQPYAYATVDNDTTAGRVMQVVRIDLSRADGAPIVVVDGLPVALREVAGVHYGSGLTFCRGVLFIGTGDTEPMTLHHLPLHDPLVLRTAAQSVFSLAGKVLAWRLSGIELGTEATFGNGLPIYAIGFRNPFGLACDVETGLPLVADNGAGHGQDQLRLVKPGTNAEWPLSDARDTLAEPLFDTGYNVRTAPTGVAIRPNPGGREVVWSAFQSEALYSLSFDSSGKATSKLRLLREVEGGGFAVAADSDGCVYFTDSQAVWRLDDGRCAR